MFVGECGHVFRDIWYSVNNQCWSTEAYIQQELSWPTQTQKQYSHLSLRKRVRKKNVKPACPAKSPKVSMKSCASRIAYMYRSQIYLYNFPTIYNFYCSCKPSGQLHPLPYLMNKCVKQQQQQREAKAQLFLFNAVKCNRYVLYYKQSNVKCNIHFKFMPF